MYHLKVIGKKTPHLNFHSCKHITSGYYIENSSGLYGILSLTNYKVDRLAGSLCLSKKRRLRTGYRYSLFRRGVGF
jgi:hypothetical protein